MRETAVSRSKAVGIAGRENTDLNPMLLLFDIDGTLLRNASGAHIQAILVALYEVYGIGTPAGDAAALPRVAAAGRTDLEIAREIALLCGRSATAFDEGRARFVELCVRAYAGLVPADLSDRVVEGMAGLLGELTQNPGVRLALVTGNLEGVARLKLARAGIGTHFEHGQGGFGSDSEDRSDLPGVARARAGTATRPYARDRTFVIGDTPLDIACARADEVGCIAVTTGPFQAPQLVGADVIAEDTARLRDAILARL
jgi:phosphoglycolate phosphatase-like HAD superfamily hydrolase